MSTYIVFLLILAITVSAVERHVAPSGQACTTVRCALDISADGDVIIIHPGTYTGPDNRNLNVGEKQVQIKSLSNNWADTIIDCEGASWGFNVEGYQQSNELLFQGFTVRNCVGTYGCALLMIKSIATIDNMRFYNNKCDQVAVYAQPFLCDETYPFIVRNTLFDENNARVPASYSNGGALSISEANPCPLRMYNVSFLRNHNDPTTKQFTQDVFDAQMKSVQWDGGVVADNFGTADFTPIVFLSALNSVKLSGLTFRNNVAGGGALFIVTQRYQGAGRVELVCCNFESDNSTLSVINGGALKVFGTPDRVILFNSSLTHNFASIAADSNFTASTAAALFVNINQFLDAVYLINTRITDNSGSNPDVQRDIYCGGGRPLGADGSGAMVISSTSVLGDFNQTRCLVDLRPTACLADPEISATTFTCPDFNTGSLSPPDTHPICSPLQPDSGEEPPANPPHNNSAQGRAAFSVVLGLALLFSLAFSV